jgi:glycosyltransferase involved in cell wall biosynthesis
MPVTAPPQDFVLIRGWLVAWTSYGQIAEWIGRSLEALGIPVRYEQFNRSDRWYPVQDWVQSRVLPIGEIPDWAWTLNLNIPNDRLPPRRHCVAFTMWEVTGLPQGSANQLNHCHAVCVPSVFNLATFAAAGVRAPLRLVPLGIDASEGYVKRDNPPSLSPSASAPFRFGCAGRVSHGGVRKGLNEAVAAFLEAFPEDRPDAPVMEVKCFPDCPAVFPEHPRVIVNREPLVPPLVADWYRSIDCYVTASKGEGWGLQTQQAMAVGRPVIASRWSGTAEFFDASCGWEVDYDLVTVPDDVFAGGHTGGNFYRDQGCWIEPRRPSLVAAMRAAASSPGALKRKARVAAERAAEYPWSRCGEALASVLREVGAIR